MSKHMQLTEHWGDGLLLRPTQPVVTRFERKYERIAAPVFSQESKPVDLHARTVG